MPDAPRLPFGPLYQAARRAAGRLPWSNDELDGFTLGQCAIALDVTRDTVNQWKRRGVPVKAGDAAAARLNLHPIEVWDEREWFTIEALYTLHASDIAHRRAARASEHRRAKAALAAFHRSGLGQDDTEEVA